MRAMIGILATAMLLFGAGCAPDGDETSPYGTGRSADGTRPGAAQDDTTGTDQSPAGSSSENAVPPTEQPPAEPSTPATPPR